MEQLTRDQVNLITSRFLTLTSKDINVSGDDTIRYVSCKFDNTRMSFKGSWRECEITIVNPQFDDVHALFFDLDIPFDWVKWLVCHNYRCWVKIRNHAIKTVDQRTKELSKIDEVLDKTFPDEVEKHLLGGK